MMRYVVEGGADSPARQRRTSQLAGRLRSSSLHTARHGWRLGWHWLHLRNRVRTDRVSFPGLVDLHVDPADERGMYVLRHRGVTQSGVTGTWRAAVQLLAPDVALDIGANYGEVSLLGRYHPGCRVRLFEPNPAVLGALRRSVASHVDSARIRVVPTAVGDSPGRATLGVADGFSGTATLRGGDAAPAPTHDVEVTTVDAVVGAEPGPRSSLVFKIDVEGFENHVLAGMQRTLEGCDTYVGIVEYDRAYLDEASPGNADATARRLCELGPCWSLEGHVLHRLGDVAAFPDHTDVVVASDVAMGERLRSPTWLRSR